MDTRPYRQTRIGELERLVASAEVDIASLKFMVEELVHFRRLRKRHRAVLVAAIQRMQTANAPFPWPSTAAPGPGSGDGFGEVFEYEIGMLRLLGYSTGHRAPPGEERRSVLDMAFVAPLPFVNDLEYMRSWGSPGSADRLHRIADSIAAATRNLKRNDEERYAVAIRHREADLAYLHERYYVRWFTHDFVWPRL